MFETGSIRVLSEADDSGWLVSAHGNSSGNSVVFTNLQRLFHPARLEIQSYSNFAKRPLKNRPLSFLEDCR